MNLEGRTLAAAGSVHSEHWKPTPNPLAHSAKVSPSLELTCERRTVPAELRHNPTTALTYPQLFGNRSPSRIVKTVPFCVNSWD